MVNYFEKTPLDKLALLILFLNWLKLPYSNKLKLDLISVEFDFVEHN